MVRFVLVALAAAGALAAAPAPTPTPATPEPTPAATPTPATPEPTPAATPTPPTPEPTPANSTPTPATPEPTPANSTPAPVTCPPAPGDKKIPELAKDTAALSTLHSLLVTAKLEDTLNNANRSFTVFAPSNAAFGELAPGITALLTKAKEDTLLPELLQYHVLAKIVAKCQISGTQEEATLLTNQSVKVVEHNGNVTVGPEGTESKVTTADVMASNGVVHVIDKVMLPATIASKLPTEDLAKLANASGFTTLYTAIAAADPSVLALLTDEKAAITCFFPTNAAFAAVDQDELSSLLNDKSKLTQVMKGHCTSEYMPKKVLESRLQSGDVKVKAVGGQDLEVKKDGDDLTINKVKIVGTDSFANNGVYHSIDRVLFTGAGGRPVAFLFLGLVGLLATLF